MTVAPIVREALCSVKGCPEPTNPDWHKCIVDGNPVIEHAHILARSQRPDLKRAKSNIVALCHAHHDLQSRNVWAFHEQALPFDGLVHQWLTDERGNIRWRRDIHGETLLRYRPPSDGSEAAQAGGLVTAYSPSEPSPGAQPGAEDIAAEDPLLDGSASSQDISGAPPNISSADSLSSARGDRERDSEASPDGTVTSIAAADFAVTPLPSPTLDAWAQRGMGLLFACKRMERMAVVVAFEVGDWINEGEASFGEKAHAFFDVFSYWQVAKWASVARRVPLAARQTNVEGITLEHHRAVADCEPDEQRALLARAADEGLSSRALRQIAAPGEPEETYTMCPTCGQRVREKPEHKE